ncbi:MAG TPA: MFS transporter [Candidatus Limnocylindrales bacterium]|nr:MFS transporter [Candidatus Limnocylindrales bacterium]
MATAETPAAIGGETIRPERTLWLLSIGHAVNHAAAVLLPLVYLRVAVEFGVGIEAVAFLAAFGALASGMVQLSYSWLTRVLPRRLLLGIGGLVFGGGMAAQAIAPGFGAFALANVASRIGGSPQHPVGNGLLAEQFPPQRRGFAISAHIAGGNLGTVAVPLIGAWLIAGIGWRWTVVLFGIPAVLIGLAIMTLVRESGADRAAARAEGSLRAAFGRILRDRDLLLLYLSSVLGGGGRGLGVVNLFVVVYLDRVLHLGGGLADWMYALLVLLSVPAPLVAGWLSDRLGRKRLIVGVYLSGAASFAFFVAAGSNLALLWLAIVFLGAFTFAESPQLQALLADIAPAGIRDASYAAYFTLAFGVGSLWTALYGAIISAAGEPVGVPIVFWLMAAAFLAAALAVLPIRAEERRAVTHAEGDSPAG